MKTKPTSLSNKTLALRTVGITLCAIVGIVALVFSFNYWQDYHDRPLASGFSHVGRDTDRGGCLLWWCWRSPTEKYYYGTDIAPKDFVAQFSTWELESIRSEDKPSVQPMISTAVSMSRDCVTMKKAQRRVFACYFMYPNITTTHLHLKKSTNKYLIYIFAEDYGVMKDSN